MKKSLLYLSLAFIGLVALGSIFLLQGYDFAEKLSTGYETISTTSSWSTDRLVYSEEKHASLDISFKIIGGILFFLGSAGLIVTVLKYQINSRIIE